MIRFMENWPDDELGVMIKHGTIEWLEEQREVSKDV